MKRLALLLAGAVLLGGCSSWHDAAPRRTQAHARAIPRRLPRVEVTVVDGDTNTRVGGARVTIGRRTVRTNPKGVARVPLARRAALVTTASKSGYGRRSVRLAFRTHPKSTMRIYRHSLQWPVYGAGPRRDQSHPAIKVRPPFRVVWSRGLGSLIEFPAVVADGVAYIGNSRGTIRALSMRDGTVIWRHDTPHGKLASSPAIVGDELLVHGMDGHVWALSRTDGRLLWHHDVGSPVESSPVVVRGVDLFGAWSGEITALDVHTHRVRWRRDDGCKITSSAAVSGGTLYLGDYCGRLLALSVENGALLWSRSVGGRVYGTPAVAGGRVFVPSSTGGSLTAFSTGGRFLWRRSTGAYVYSSPAAVAGRVFFGSYNGVLYAVSARSGRTLWERSAGGPISGAVEVVDGVAYAGSFSHRIVGADVRSGTTARRLPARRVRPRLRQRQATAPARLFARVRGGRALKRLLLAAAALLVLTLLGAGLAYYLHVKHASRDIQGSSTIEFVTTEAVPPPPKEPGIAWPTYGHDPERTRVANGITLAPPYRTLGAFTRRASSSSLPSSATAGCSSPPTRACCSRSARRTASVPGSTSRTAASQPRPRSTGTSST